jgi:hypothetical protein
MDRFFINLLPMLWTDAETAGPPERERLGYNAALGRSSEFLRSIP